MGQWCNLAVCNNAQEIKDQKLTSKQKNSHLDITCKLLKTKEETLEADSTHGGAQMRMTADLSSESM